MLVHIILMAIEDGIEKGRPKGNLTAFPQNQIPSLQTRLLISLSLPKDTYLISLFP